MFDLAGLAQLDLRAETTDAEQRAGLWSIGGLDHRGLPQAAEEAAFLRAARRGRVPAASRSTAATIVSRPATFFLAAITGSAAPGRARAAQSGSSGQASQRGSRGVHTVAPSSISASLKRPGRSSGTRRRGDRPERASRPAALRMSLVDARTAARSTRATLPSTSGSRLSKAMLAMAPAVYAPMPGSSRSAVGLAGKRAAVALGHLARASRGARGRGGSSRGRSTAASTSSSSARGERRDVGEAREEALEVRDHRLDARLLEHDLARARPRTDRAVAAPRQIRAPRVEPGRASWPGRIADSLRCAIRGDRCGARGVGAGDAEPRACARGAFAAASPESRTTAQLRARSCGALALPVSPGARGTAASRARPWDQARRRRPRARLRERAATRAAAGRDATARDARAMPPIGPHREQPAAAPAAPRRRGARRPVRVGGPWVRCYGSFHPAGDPVKDVTRLVAALRARERDERPLQGAARGRASPRAARGVTETFEARRGECYRVFAVAERGGHRPRRRGAQQPRRGHRRRSRRGRLADRPARPPVLPARRRPLHRRGLGANTGAGASPRRCGSCAPWPDAGPEAARRAGTAIEWARRLDRMAAVDAIDAAPLRHSGVRRYEGEPRLKGSWARTKTCRSGRRAGRPGQGDEGRPRRQGQAPLRARRPGDPEARRRARGRVGRDPPGRGPGEPAQLRAGHEAAEGGAALPLPQIDDTKNGLYRVVAKEIRDVLEQTQFADEITKVLTKLSFEIKTEIRFIPNDAATKRAERRTAKTRARAGRTAAEARDRRSRSR